MHISKGGAGRFWITGALGAACAAFSQPSVPIRWAAVGNSITEWSGYSDKLETLLGPAYKVENEGVAATTLLKKSGYSYWTNGKLPQTFAFKPDIVSFMLGTNDSKPVNWPSGKASFLNDTRALIDTFATMATKPRIFPCYPVPVFQKNGSWSVDGINDPVIKDQIIPLLRQAATEKKLDTIDLHTFLENRGDLFTNDGVHPDAGKAGADSIAAMMFRIYKAKSTRIACIGNSITDNNHDANAYPIRFNELLGRQYYVLNAGHSGRTLLRKGDSPYAQSEWFREVFKFQPDIVTIKLGTNDSKPYNWDAHKNEFIPDLNWLIDTLGTIPTKPRIILCTPIPAWKNSDGTFPYDIQPDVIKNEIIPKIKQVAADRKLELIDLYTPYLPYRNLTPDNVHPNAAGLDTLAHMLYRAFQDLPGPVGLGHGKGAATRNREAHTGPFGLDWAKRFTPAWLNALLGRRIRD
jgi:lysophospholipase L1-like esterase